MTRIERELLLALLPAASRVATRKLTSAMRPHRLTPAQHAIIDLLIRKGRLPLWRIAEELAVDQSTIVSTLTRLERDGYVRREKNPEDRRSSFSTVTEAARQAHAEAQPSIDAAAREILGDIPDEELKAGRRLLVRIIGAAAAGDGKD